MPVRTFRSVYRSIRQGLLNSTNPSVTLSTGIVHTDRPSADQPGQHHWFEQASVQIAHQLPVEPWRAALTQHQDCRVLGLCWQYESLPERTARNTTCPCNLPWLRLSTGVGGGELQHRARSAVSPPGFHSIRLSTNEANSHYHGLQLDVNSQVGRDLYLRAFYTYSKTIDPGTGNTAGTNGGSGGQDLQHVSNPYLGWRYDVGPSGFDPHPHCRGQFHLRHPALARDTEQAPENGARRLAISGIFTMESGLPVNIGLTGGQAGTPCPTPPTVPTSSAKFLSEDGRSWEPGHPIS